MPFQFACIAALVVLLAAQPGSASPASADRAPDSGTGWAPGQEPAADGAWMEEALLRKGRCPPPPTPPPTPCCPQGHGCTACDPARHTCRNGCCGGSQDLFCIAQGKGSRPRGTCQPFSSASEASVDQAPKNDTMQTPWQEPAAKAAPMEDALDKKGGCPTPPPTDCFPPDSANL